MQSGTLKQEVFLPLEAMEKAAPKQVVTISDPLGFVFERLKCRLMESLGGEVYSSWFGRLKLEDTSGGSICISVPTTFLRSWINTHYLDLITRLWQEEDSSTKSVEIVVRSAARNVMPKVTNEIVRSVSSVNKAAAVVQNGSCVRKSLFQKPHNMGSGHNFLSQNTSPCVLGSPLDNRYRFDSFVEGTSNRVAFAAARAVAESCSGIARFNPLFLHATVGLGKTHLLQSIAAESLRQNAHACVVYLTAEYFMWRFATAIRDNNALTFKEQLRDIDLLIIDDMQFLQGKSIQNEFCHLLNMLLDSAKQVVVAADRPPSDLESLEQRVRSRLVGGMALEIGKPDYDMRLHILQQRLIAAKETDPSLHIPEDILAHVAQSITGSGRDLEGAFNQLLFRHAFEPKMDIGLIDDILRCVYRAGEPKRIRIEDIQRVVTQHYNISRTDLLSSRRTRTIVKPRQIAMYLCKIMTPRSLPEIGRRFGGRDHTTALHAIRKIEELCQTDNNLAQELELLRRLILDQV